MTVDLESNGYNYNEYSKMVCTIMNGRTESGTVTYNIHHYSNLSKFELSEECTVFDIQLEEVPRILNDMSYTRSYGLDIPKCIVVPFNGKTQISSTEEMTLSGAIVKFYIPDKIGKIQIYDSDGYLKLTLKCMSQTDWQSYLEEEFNDVSDYEIDEWDYKRTATLVITSSEGYPDFAEVAVHTSIPCNEHLGQSALVWFDLRPNVFLSTIFSNIMLNNRKVSLLNGNLICDDFSKFYLGSPSTKE